MTDAADLPEDDEALELDQPGERVIEIAPDEAGARLDKALADRLPELSRGRVQALMAAGMVTRDG